MRSTAVINYSKEPEKRMMNKKEEREKSGFGVANFERRKNPRFLLNCPVEYWQVENSKNRIGRTGDISEGGLLLFLPDEMNIGQHIRMKLFIGELLGLKTIEFLVRVVWKDLYLEGEDDYRMGAEFIDISATDLDKLKLFLETLIRKRDEITISPRLKMCLPVGGQELK